MKWGWIDLIASIPNLQVLRWGRLVRVLRVIRLLRGVRSVQRFSGETKEILAKLELIQAKLDALNRS